MPITESWKLWEWKIKKFQVVFDKKYPRTETLPLKHIQRMPNTKSRKLWEKKSKKLHVVSVKKYPRTEILAFKNTYKEYLLQNLESYENKEYKYVSNTVVKDNVTLPLYEVKWVLFKRVLCKSTMQGLR